MTPSHFADFDDNDELEFEGNAESTEYDGYLTVHGLLRTHFGDEHGDEIYELLRRTAQKHADSIQDFPTSAGILFTDDGGEFVGFEQDFSQEEEEI